MQIEMPNEMTWKRNREAPLPFEDSNLIDIHDPKFARLCDEMIAHDFKQEFTSGLDCPWIIMRRIAGDWRAYLFRVYTIEDKANVEACWIAKCDANGTILEDFRLVRYTILFSALEDSEIEVAEACKVIKDYIVQNYMLNDKAPIHVLMGNYRHE